MRLLWIATKSPWPPVDGGRLLLAETLAAVAQSGARITLIAPMPAGSPGDAADASMALSAWCRPVLVATSPRSRVAAAVRSLAIGQPWSVARHDSRVLRAAVERELTRRRPDAVVAEQLQAFPQAAPAAAAGVPLLLRAQNVESDLWRQLAVKSRGSRRMVLGREAARLARAERRALAEASATIALSSADAILLAALFPAAARPPRIEVVAPPFPGELPGAVAKLAGEPALVLFGSAGWEPNSRASRHFLRDVWPRVQAELPGARLHVFGNRGAIPSEPAGERATDSLVAHPAPGESRSAFASGALLLLPLDLASGVRMRILEAWARGTAVLASPAAASGLRFTPGEELLLAATAEETVREVARFAREPDLSRRLVAAGRARLELDHDPARFAARFLEITRELVGRPGRTGKRETR